MATAENPPQQADPAGSLPLERSNGRPPLPRRKRWGLVLLLAALLLAAGLLPTLAARTPLLAWAIRRAARWDGGVVVRSASLGWCSPVVVEGVELRDAQDRPFLRFDRPGKPKAAVANPAQPPRGRLVPAGAAVADGGGPSRREQPGRSAGQVPNRGGCPHRAAFALQIVDGSVTVVDAQSDAQLGSPEDRSGPGHLARDDPAGKAGIDGLCGRCETAGQSAGAFRAATPRGPVARGPAGGARSGPDPRPIAPGSRGHPRRDAPAACRAARAGTSPLRHPRLEAGLAVDGHGPGGRRCRADRRVPGSRFQPVWQRDGTAGSRPGSLPARPSSADSSTSGRPRSTATS